MGEPLDGIRVVEAGVAVVGPAAGVFLADMGAEVIKVETPLGDSMRGSRGVGNRLPLEAPTPMMVAANRGKKSIQIDLGTEDGQEAVHRLLATADVFLTNYREDGLTRMGLDEPTLRALNPRLIYACSTGFGPSGPEAGKAMLDLAVQARGGILSMLGTPNEAPYVSGAIIGDTAGSMLLALGVMTALVVRERTGIAQRVDTSPFAAQLFLQSTEIAQTSITGNELTRQGRFSSNVNGMYGAYATADDRLVVLGMVYQPDWVDFCTFAGVADLIDHPLWSNFILRSGLAGDAVDVTDLRHRLAEGARTHTLAEWTAFLRSKPDIVSGVAQTYREVLHDAQARANGYIVDVELPVAGTKQIVGNVVGFSETPPTVKTSIPTLGEHNLELLTELGYSIEQVAAMFAQLDDGAQRLLERYQISADDLAAARTALESVSRA